MPVLIPERTIDSLFAFEFLSVAPTATIWSPHNNRGPGTVDHEIQTSRRYFEVECKTIYRDDDLSPWEVKVRLAQLSDYLKAGKRQLMYLLPSRPVDDKLPWHRVCSSDPDWRGFCRACADSPLQDGALFWRRRAYREPHIRRASPEVKLQPWFNHWAWCISAADLDRYIAANRQFVSRGEASLPAQDSHLASIPGTERLCHFFEAVDIDFSAIYPRPGHPFDVDRERRRFPGLPSLDDWTIPVPNEQAAFPVEPTPEQAVDEETRRVQVWY